ncbi:serine endoprotease [compost metagenome]
MKKFKKILIVMSVLSTIISAPAYASTNLPFQVMSKEDVYRKDHSIVQVTNTFTVKDKNTGKRQSYEGKGSGFFITKDLVVTSYHVINKVENQVSQSIGISFGYAKINIFKNYYSKVIATDPAHDIAILKVERTEPIEISVPLKLASLESIDTTPKFTFYGYPGEERRFRYTPADFIGYKSVGFVDSFNNTSYNIPVIAFTGVIYKGNSGGPLLNDKGEVVTLVGFSNEEIDDHGGNETYGLDPKIFQEFVTPYIQNK